MKQNSIPNWQVHRGYWQGGLRENTLQAFYAAKQLGAQMVELDVRLSRDGIPIVFHDLTLDRLFHIKDKVTRTKSDVLQELNIPKLRDVVKSENSPNYINVELKSKSLLPFTLVKGVSIVLLAHPKKRYVISSFNPLCLWWARKLMPQFPRALIIDNPKVLLGKRMELYMKWAAPQYIHVKEELIDDEETRNAIIAWELPVVVWTVNDEKKAKFLLERGAISIISDLLPPKDL